MQNDWIPGKITPAHFCLFSERCSRSTYQHEFLRQRKAQGSKLVTDLRGRGYNAHVMLKIEQPFYKQERAPLRQRQTDGGMKCLEFAYRRSEQPRQCGRNPKAEIVLVIQEQCLCLHCRAVNALSAGE